MIEAAIIANPLVLHDQFAGMYAGIESLARACRNIVSNPQGEALKAWTSIFNINCWPIFAVAKDIREHLDSNVLTLLSARDPTIRTGSAGEETAAQIRTEIVELGFDLVIMTPRFTNATKHDSSHADITIPVLAAFDASTKDQRVTEKRVSRLAKGTCCHGDAYLASALDVCTTTLLLFEIGYSENRREARCGGCEERKSCVFWEVWRIIVTLCSPCCIWVHH